MKLLNAFKYGIILLFILTLIGAWTTAHSQDAPAVPPSEEPKSREVFRVTKIEWNLQKHKLLFSVVVGDCEKPLSKENTCKDGDVVMKYIADYSIDPDNALMWTQDETRKFSLNEATNVLHPLLDYLSRYTAESHLWWEAGQGEKVDKRAKLPLRNPPGITFESKNAGVRTMRK